MWLAAAVLLLFDLGTLFLSRVGRLDAGAALLILFVAALLTGLEAAEWRRRAAMRRGRALVGLAPGVDEVDALARLAGRSDRIAEAQS